MLKAITSTAWLLISKKESSGESGTGSAAGLKQGESSWSRPGWELLPGVSLSVTFSWDRGRGGCSLFSDVSLNKPFLFCLLLGAQAVRKKHLPTGPPAQSPLDFAPGQQLQTESQLGVSSWPSPDLPERSEAGLYSSARYGELQLICKLSGGGQWLCTACGERIIRPPLLPARTPWAASVCGSGHTCSLFSRAGPKRQTSQW